MPAWVGILLFVFGVVVMILVHEAGHFVAARAFGIRVQEFFIGFGPRLWSFRRKGTEYGVKALPLGGYVRIAGMNPLEEPAPEDRGRTFSDKPKWQRAVVLGAGAATHFVLALFLLGILFGALGTPTGFVPQVRAVEARLDGRPSPAAQAGLRPGDQIVSVDGREVDYQRLLGYVDSHVGDRVVLGVERDGERLMLAATPVLSRVEGKQIGRLGIVLQPGGVIGRDRAGPGETIVLAGRTVGAMTVDSFRAMGRIFGPEGLGRIGEVLVGGRERTVQDPVGVVGAARVSGQAVEAGLFDAVLQLFAFFNVFVGILNLLPLPPLGFEAVTRRRVDPRRLIPVTALVAGFLVLFTAAIVYLDIISPIPNPFQ